MRLKIGTIIDTHYNGVSSLKPKIFYLSLAIADYVVSTRHWAANDGVWHLTFAYVNTLDAPNDLTDRKCT